MSQYISILTRFGHGITVSQQYVVVQRYGDLSKIMPPHFFPGLPGLATVFALRSPMNRETQTIFSLINGGMRRKVFGE